MTSTRAASAIPRRRIRHIAFYGTLCARHKAHVRLKLPAALTFLGRRALRGTLYDLGEYPGFVPGPGKAIAELYRIRDDSILARLDEFEGYDARNPARSRFVRSTVRVPRSESGTAVAILAWIYVFTGSTTGRREVPGGWWRRRTAKPNNTQLPKACCS